MLTSLIGACAVKVNPGGPIQVNPIQVTVDFNFDTINAYFTDECESQLSQSNYSTTAAYNAAVQACANADTGSFLSAFSQILAPGQTMPTPTPSPSPSPTP